MGAEGLLCGVELGGTKCVCLAGSRDGNVLAQVALPTGSEPGLTLQRIADQLRDCSPPCTARAPRSAWLRSGRCSCGVMLRTTGVSV